MILSCYSLLATINLFAIFMELKRVVVTGMGAITPIGNSVEEVWNNALNGVSGAALITHFDTEKFKTKFACEVKGFNAADYIDAKEARKMDLLLSICYRCC